jgi:hypothetical protein
MTEAPTPPLLVSLSLFKIHISMVPYSSTPLTGREIRKAARAAVTVLEANGLSCCLFGSAACAIYGMENREPNVRTYLEVFQVTLKYFADFFVVLGRRHYSDVDEGS